MSSRFDVAVIGGGIMGSCLALELAARGVKVGLIDREHRPLNRTSIRNEGKVHLGLVYANDPTFETGEMMLQGALQFEPNMRRWIGDTFDQITVGDPFKYVVAHESILTPSQLEEHYERCSSRCRELLAENPEWSYVGTRPESLAKPLPESKWHNWYSTDRVQAVYETAELGVSTGEVANFLRAAIEAQPNIEFASNFRVRELQRTENGFAIQGEGIQGAPTTVHAEQVANTAWDGRLALDQSLGINLNESVGHRIKFRMIGKSTVPVDNVPSSTMVIGRFGDVVVWPDGRIYVSWYPVAMKGWSHDILPPEEWNDACRGIISGDLKRELTQQMFEATKKWHLTLPEMTDYDVGAGVIVAHGTKDVDKPDSGLHNRSSIGVTSYDGYHSVWNGKYTTSPMFAVETADAITQVSLAK